MKIFLTDQKLNFKKHLDEFKNVHVMPYAKGKLAEKTTSVKIETGKAVQELDLDFLFNYKIFPPNILSYFTQWQAEVRQMRVGDTVVQQIYLPPIPVRRSPLTTSPRQQIPSFGVVPRLRRPGSKSPDLRTG